MNELAIALFRLAFLPIIDLLQLEAATEPVSWEELLQPNKRHSTGLGTTNRLQPISRGSQSL